jgi:hypothetical protein
MLFTDLAHPSTIAVLLVEAVLFGLALAAGFQGVLVRPVRWLARGLAALMLLLGIAFAAGMLLELTTSRLPLVLADAPLVTYAQMTQLGLLQGVLTFGLIALGAALAFRRPRLGGLLLLLTALLGLLEEGRRGLHDPTLPLPNLIFGVLLLLLALAAGALVLGAWRAERRPPRTTPALARLRGTLAQDGP